MNYEVSFIVKDTGAVVTKKFDSLYRCKNFVNKLEYSKKLQVISHPAFN